MSRPAGGDARRGRVRQWIFGLSATLAALLFVVLAIEYLPQTQFARDQLWGLGTAHYADFDRKLAARRMAASRLGIGTGELQPDADSPLLQPAGGIYDGPVRVRITRPAGNVHCTTDGSIPTDRDPPYTDPLEIPVTTVLRCRTFRAGHQASPTVTQTYFVDPPGALPLLAVTVHPGSLWNRYTGIYEQYEEKGREWERDSHVEYFPRGTGGALAIEGRIRIHGGWSRSRPKKSFRFYFDPLPPQLEDAGNILTWQTPLEQRVVIFGAREDDVSRDELFADVLDETGGLTSARMPVFLYLNGKPWGTYFIRERVDLDYVQRHVGPGSYDLLVSEPSRPRIMEGDRDYWNEMLGYLDAHDLADDAAFAAVAARYVDLDSFIDYWLLNVYGGNSDWPHHNMSMFSNRDGPDRRWRWICWDADGTFDFGRQGLHYDTLAWATRAEVRHDLRFNNHLGNMDSADKVVATYLARKLLENAGFRVRLVRRMTQLLDSVLSPPRLEALLDALDAELASDMPLDWARWEPDDGGARLARAYAEDLSLVRTFIRERPAVIRQQFSRLVTAP